MPAPLSLTTAHLPARADVLLACSTMSLCAEALTAPNRSADIASVSALRVTRLDTRFSSRRNSASEDTHHEGTPQRRVGDENVAGTATGVAATRDTR